MRVQVPHAFILAITLLGSALTQPLLRAQAPQPAAQQFRPDDQLPFDSAVRRGTLPNGFTYYVRANSRPAARLSLRLAVKAGSMHEADDQQGLAHFLEHMAFNGSASFKPGELISYFESTGARLGPHVNAYTSFDETVYMLELPTDMPEIVARGFAAMADFAGGLSLDPEQVEKERGVVIEEWRGRLGAGSRVRDKQLPLLYYRSRYADRLPIGKPEVLRSAPAARLRAFYDAWYRPERMALIVVGDIDAAQVEATIRSTFGKLTARAAGLSEPDDSVPLHDEVLVSSISDSEVTSSTVQVVSKQKGAGDSTVGDYRRAIVDRLFERMLNERFDELSRKPDAAFLAAGGGGGSLNEEVDTFSLSARVPDGGISKGLAAIALEARRARELGFTASELDRAKRSLLASYERAYNERDKSESGSFAQEYVSHFLTEEPSPGIQYQYQLVQSVLPGISLSEIAARAKLRLADDSRVVLAVSPEKKELTQTTDAELRSAFDSVSKFALLPWSESDPSRPLMATPPKPAQVVSTREIPAIGVTVVRFSNGVEAWLKPTDFKNDQVLFTMYAPGGASLAEPEDFLEASFATSFIGLSGLGGFSEVELNRMLAGKRASASPFISLSTHGVSGSAAPTELETALQLLYLGVTAPGDSDEAFALMRRQLDAMVANRGQDPGEVFSERLGQVNASDHYTARPLTPEDVAGLDRAKMTSYYVNGSATPPTSRFSWSVPSTWMRSFPSSPATSAGCLRLGRRRPRSSSSACASPPTTNGSGWRRGASHAVTRCSASSPTPIRIRCSKSGRSRQRWSCRPRSVTSCAKSSARRIRCQSDRSSRCRSAATDTSRSASGRRPRTSSRWPGVSSRRSSACSRKGRPRPRRRAPERARAAATKPRSSRMRTGSGGSRPCTCSAAIRSRSPRGPIASKRSPLRACGMYSERCFRSLGTPW